jgi:hypothetical protein
MTTTIKKTSWSESASELYRPSDSRMSAKFVPTFEDRGCHVDSVADPYGRILDLLDRSRYNSFNNNNYNNNNNNNNNNKYLKYPKTIIC